MTSGQTLDPEILASLRGDDDPDSAEFVIRLIDQFLAEATERVAAMHAALAGQDAAGLKAAAHRLKGSAVTMGAAPLGRLCDALEERMRGGQPTASVAGLVHDLADEMSRVQQACLSERAALRS